MTGQKKRRTFTIRNWWEERLLKFLKLGPPLYPLLPPNTLNLIGTSVPNRLGVPNAVTQLILELGLRTFVKSALKPHRHFRSFGLTNNVSH